MSSIVVWYFDLILSKAGEKALKLHPWIEFVKLIKISSDFAYNDKCELTKVKLPNRIAEVVKILTRLDSGCDCDFFGSSFFNFSTILTILLDAFQLTFITYIWLLLTVTPFTFLEWSTHSIQKIRDDNIIF